MVKLGTLRVVFARVYDEIAEKGSKSETEICRDGDKYAFALDGLIVNFDAKEADPYPYDSKILIDFSIYPADKEEVLLADFPYSCRGTRQNPKYIPLSKGTDFPILPPGRKFYYKISNTETTAGRAILGVAIVIFGRPVIEE